MPWPATTASNKVAIDRRPRLDVRPAHRPVGATAWDQPFQADYLKPTEATTSSVEMRRAGTGNMSITKMIQMTTCLRRNSFRFTLGKFAWSVAPTLAWG